MEHDHVTSKKILYFLKQRFGGVQSEFRREGNNGFRPTGYEKVEKSGALSRMPPKDILKLLQLRFCYD